MDNSFSICPSLLLTSTAAYLTCIVLSVRREDITLRCRRENACYMWTEEVCAKTPTVDIQCLCQQKGVL